VSSYTNITNSLAVSVDGYISNWVRSKDCFEKHVLARGGHLGLIPLFTITSVVDTIVGAGAGIVSIATGGTYKATCDFAMNHLDSSRNIVAYPYTNLLRTLNPEAKFPSSVASHSYFHSYRYWSQTIDQGSELITNDGDGFITSYVSDALKDVARSCRNSDNFFKRHIVSRLTYLLLAISSLITRVVDGIIGVIAAILSFLTLGKVGSINNVAFRALQAPGIVKDLFYCAIKCINPWAGAG
jgi:hypothetical protein